MITWNVFWITVTFLVSIILSLVVPPPRNEFEFGNSPAILVAIVTGLMVLWRAFVWLVHAAQ
jgi:hypothetical protein